MPTVPEHLSSRGIAFETIPHAQTYTSIDEARALGISADEVLKSLMLRASSGYALAVLPGIRRLDMRLARQAIGDRHAVLATEEELQRDFPGFELGALPPLGSLLGVPVYLDPEVLEHETVLFASGSQTESIKAGREELFRDEPVSVTPLARHRDEDEEALG